MRIAQLTVSCIFSETSSSLQELNQVPSLLQEYKSCLATRKFDEAKKINKEINDLITNEINTTGEELWNFADGLQWRADRFEESIPVLFATASLFKKEGNLYDMSWSVGYGGYAVPWEGMHGAIRSMIERDVTMKEVAKHHVIPLMHDVKNQMLEMTSVSEKDNCERMSWVLACIAVSEELIDDDVAAKEAREESKVWKERRRRIEEQGSKPWRKNIRDVL